MRPLMLVRSTLAALLLVVPAGAQSVKINFSQFASPFTTEYSGAIGAPLTSGGLDFLTATGLDNNASNAFGVWGTNDPGTVNRPSNIGSATTIFASTLGSRIDIVTAGTDFVTGPFVPFNLFSLDIASLYSSAFSPIALVDVNLRFFGFPVIGDTFFQDFLLPAPALIGGVRTPILQTLIFDQRFRGVEGVAYFQGTGSGSATQFTNVVTGVVTPEPASLVLLATGLAGIFGVARRRRTSVVSVVSLVVTA